MGPMPSDGEASMVGSKVAGGHRPPGSLAGMMTTRVKTKPQQNASREPPAIPPMIATSLRLDFIYHLSMMAAYTRTARMRTSADTDRSTERKTVAKLMGGLSHS